jgi:23S rRNA (adenine2030-N6)-methyltransferase
MNYRHLYHAGNFADVVKHLTLVLLLEHLRRKPEPFCYLDTHAGIGRYPLDSIEAQKTGEYRAGIGKLLTATALPAPIADYRGLVLAADPLNQPSKLHAYPGSPLLARALLRPQDRAVLMELHPADAGTLKRLFRGDIQVAVHHMNGYHGLKAFVPPKERRGLVLIDPPFEVEDEFEQLLAGLVEAHRRWATGIYAIWYPIKDRRGVWRFHNALKKTGLRKLLLAEFCLYPEDLPDRFNGCGMIIVNPPWQLDARLRELYSALTERLGEPDQARVNVDWLVPE